MFAAALMAELDGVEAASVSMRPAADVARARFEDGAARQAAASSGVVETWRLRALVKPGRLEAFRTWAEAQGAGWFNFLAPASQADLLANYNDELLQGRFVGGAGHISYQQVGTGAGAARWTAEMEIERKPRYGLKGGAGVNTQLWPFYAEIKSDLALGGTLQAERTGLRGMGVGRQAGREDAPWRTWRVAALVPADRLFEFIDWFRRNRAGWIWMPAADGAAWRARLAGGFGGLALRQAGTRPGLARWEAAFTLEAPAPVEVKANVGRSIFDPAVTLGDASRVYWRQRLEFEYSYDRGQRLTAGGDRTRGLTLLPGGPLPAKFIVGGVKAHLSTIDWRASGVFRVRLMAPGQADGHVPGPHLTPAARNGLCFILLWGGHQNLITVQGDVAEPYVVSYAGDQLTSFRRMMNSRRSGPADVAVAWRAPGAEETGFLEEFYTTRGGAAAP